MFKNFRLLLEMIRFSHSVFALPFAMLAAVMAWTAETPSGNVVSFSWRHLIGLLVCIVSARSAAMAFNRIADQEIDRLNPRTAQRHLPTKQISLATAIVFTLASCVVFVLGTALFWPNRIPLSLSGPVLLFVLGYSYTKRFTWLAHFWLGAALMLAPLATWLALRGEIVIQNPLDVVPAFVLGLAVMFWVAGFDVIYACQDFDFDRSHRLHSIPARFGIASALRLAALSHGLMIACLATLPVVSSWAGPRLDLGWLYWAALASIALLLIYEHSLVRADNLSRVNLAFFHVNAVISMGLFAVGTVDLLFV